MRTGNTQIVSVKMSEGVRAILQEAADYRGKRLSTFIRDAAIKAAEMDELVRRMHRDDEEAAS